MFPFLMIAGMLGQAYFQSKAAASQTAALELEAKQANLQHAQKTLSNYGTLQSLLSTQLAQESTRGVKLNSPSFNAIQRKTFNTGMDNQRNLDIENNISQANLKTEKQNVKNNLFGQLFGDATQTFSSISAVSKANPWAYDPSNNGQLDIFGNVQHSPIEEHSAMAMNVAQSKPLKSYELPFESSLGPGTKFYKAK